MFVPTFTRKTEGNVTLSYLCGMRTVKKNIQRPLALGATSSLVHIPYCIDSSNSNNNGNEVSATSVPHTRDSRRWRPWTGRSRSRPSPLPRAGHLASCCCWNPAGMKTERPRLAPPRPCPVDFYFRAFYCVSQDVFIRFYTCRCAVKFSAHMHKHIHDKCALCTL